MSDPQVPQSDDPKNIDEVVDSANAGLAEAEAAAAGTSGDVAPGDVNADAEALTKDAPADAAEPVDAQAPKGLAAEGEDPDLAAFAEAEKAFPGVFDSAPEQPAASGAAPETKRADFDMSAVPPIDVTGETRIAETVPAEGSVAETTVIDDAPTRVADTGGPVSGTFANAGGTPIFVQAPEPPRDLGNRGAIAGIGLLAALSFAILFLAAHLGFGFINGSITPENIVDELIATAASVSFWVTVVVFYVGFCLLGAFVNRGRWGYWVIFGIIVGVISYAGHLLGALVAAPFWNLTASQGTDLVAENVLTPLAIVAFVLGREITIWFGAWASKSGARKNVLNEEAQREYEATIEAGPNAAR